MLVKVMAPSTDFKTVPRPLPALTQTVAGVVPATAMGVPMGL